MEQPLEYGGLGILNLEYMSWALQVRCLWFEKTDPGCHWKDLEIPIHRNAIALFWHRRIAIASHVGRATIPYFGLIDGYLDAAHW